eukprot:6206361-Pleurochrysis_carterae.AAC.2
MREAPRRFSACIEESSSKSIILAVPERDAQAGGKHVISELREAKWHSTQKRSNANSKAHLFENRDHT